MKKLIDKEVKVGMLILCVSFACLIHVSCHKKCKDYTFYETAPVILEYFGNYKPGNYWIYENQDGTKRDSIWISDYEEIVGERLTCIKYPTKQYIVHSSYLSVENQIKAEIKLNSIYYYSNGTIGYYTLSSTNDTELQNEKLLYNYKNSISALHFPVVTKVSIFNEYDVPNIIYAKNIGIVQFHSKSINNFYSPISDTFFLTKYFVE